MSGLTGVLNVACDQPVDAPKNDLRRLITLSVTRGKIQRNWKAPSKRLAIGVQPEEDPLAPVSDNPVEGGEGALTPALGSGIHALQS